MPAHFRRWLTLFHETIEVGRVAPRADRARELVDAVARVHSELVGKAVTIAAGARTPAPSAASIGPGVSPTS